jgi:hypothetical protein
MNKAQKTPPTGNEDLFPSVLQLASDPGPFGFFLRRIELEILRDADRWPEPWKHLMSVRCLPKEFQPLFRAAHSQRTAITRLGRIAIKMDSLENQRSAKIHPGNREEQAVLKSMWKYEGLALLLNSAKKHSPELEAQVQERIAAIRDKERRRSGLRKAVPSNKPAAFGRETIGAKLAWEMTTGWLHSPDGCPGYCFFSNAALQKFISILLRSSNPDFPDARTIRTICSHLGLQKGPLLVSNVKVSEGRVILLDKRAQRI